MTCTAAVILHVIEWGLAMTMLSDEGGIYTGPEGPRVCIGGRVVSDDCSGSRPGLAKSCDRQQPDSVRVTFGITGRLSSIAELGGLLNLRH